MNHIFYMQFDTSMTDEERDLFLQCLTVARKERVLRLKGRESSIKCLQTGLFLRYCLDACGVQCTNEDILVAEDDKPYIKNNPVFFNISHSDNYVVVMISDQCCGIDLQKNMDFKERLAKKIMHEREYALVCEYPEDKDALMTACWAGKEAYLKYTGSGIRYAMSSVDVSELMQHFRDKKTDCLTLIPEKKQVFMRHYLIDNQYFLAVCKKEHFVQPIIRKVDINQVYSSMKSLYL